MKLENFEEKWQSIPNCENSYQRIDSTHVMDFYVGRDVSNTKELLLVSEFEPSKLKSSKSIEVVTGKRKDEKWAIHFHLKKKEQEEVFIKLCWDLIESSRKSVNTLHGMENVITRFTKWQKLMEQGNNGMPESVIRGLIGELLYLKTHVMQRYDIDTSISMWLGPDGSDRDFTYNDSWTEVKTIAPGIESVHITSVEQLDIISEGKLAVIYLDGTSPIDESGFSLYNLIIETRSLLTSSPVASDKFEEKLFNLGYFEKEEYKEKCYRCDGMRFFEVKGDFPRIRRDSLNIGIAKVKYDILLSSICQFETSEAM